MQNRLNVCQIPKLDRVSHFTQKYRMKQKRNRNNKRCNEFCANDFAENGTFVLLVAI